MSNYPDWVMMVSTRLSWLRNSRDGALIVTARLLRVGGYSAWTIDILLKSNPITGMIQSTLHAWHEQPFREPDFGKQTDDVDYATSRYCSRHLRTAYFRLLHLLSSYRLASGFSAYTGVLLLQCPYGRASCHASQFLWDVLVGFYHVSFDCSIAWTGARLEGMILDVS